MESIDCRNTFNVSKEICFIEIYFFNVLTDKCLLFQFINKTANKLESSEQT